MKILAVGDIHTKTWIIDLVESVIENYDAVVFVGDYADDFNTSAIKSIETWKKLRYLMGEFPKVSAVYGNHDFIYVNKTPTKQSGYDYTTQTLINAPENRDLKEWLLALPPIIQMDGVFYSHAGIDENWVEAGKKLDWHGEMNVEQMWRDVSPIWTRPDWAKYQKVPQVFGHTPSKTCWEVEKNIWCIDTFSTYSDNSPYGDGTMLEVVNGQKFKKIKINANHNDPSGIEGGVPRPSP